MEVCRVLSKVRSSWVLCQNVNNRKYLGNVMIMINQINF